MTDTYNEVKQIKSLNFKLIRIRVSYKSENKSENKAIMTSPYTNISEIPIIIKQLQEKCNFLNIDIEKIKVLHLHLEFDKEIVKNNKKNKNHSF